MNRVACLSLFLISFSLVPSARAQGWPPLKAEERSDSRTTQVLGVPFTTGYFSYWVRTYRANKVNYSKSNYFESRSWRRGIGPDGVITSSPETLKGGPSPSQLLSPAIPPFPAAPPARIPALPELPVIPQVAPLGKVRPLAPLSSNVLPPIPSLPSTPPLASSNSLPPLPRLNP